MRQCPQTIQFAEFAARAVETKAELADLVVVSPLSDLFSDAGDDLPTVTWFVRGRVFPTWDSITLDIGPWLCHETVAHTVDPNVSADDVEDRLVDCGEIGAVVMSCDFGSQYGLTAPGSDEQDGLTVAGTDSELRTLMVAFGSGSEEMKLKTLYNPLNRTDPDEARFLTRPILFEICIGAGERTIRNAVAEALLVIPAGAVAIHDDNADAKTEVAVCKRRSEAITAVVHALQTSNGYGMVAGFIRNEGEAGLDGVRLEVGRPVQVMLAQVGTVVDALGEQGTVVIETKFDGAHVQIHRGADDGVLLPSRSMEDIADALSEVTEFIADVVDDPAILDGEVMAMDDSGEPLPFQEIPRRFYREHDANRMCEEVRVKLRVFDYLHTTGDDLLADPLAARCDRLTALLGNGSPAVSGLLLSGDPDEIVAHETDVLDAGHEGIMLKNPDTPYSSGDCEKNWPKHKSDAEMLNLIVTGVEWDEDRRAEFLGTSLLSARVEVESGDDAFETIGEVAMDITDEELVELTDLLEPEVEHEAGKEVDIRLSAVFEIGYGEI